MTPKTIPADVAEELYESDPGDSLCDWALIGRQHIRTSRWHEEYWLVVSDEDGAEWGLAFRLGLTECQEHELPWDGVARDLPLVRLYRHVVTTAEYRTEPAS